MKLRTFAGGFVLGVAAAIAAGAAFSAQEAGKTKSPPDKPAVHMPTQEEMAAGMKAWMDAATPGEEHKKMAKAVGSYDTVTRIWMAGPDAPPSETKGTSEIKSVLDGRFLLQTEKGQFPMPDMQTGEVKMTPMEGIGLFGYDNYQKMYVGCWADSLGTQLLNMRGTLSPDGKTSTMYGEMDEPMLGVRGRMVKYVTQHLEGGNHVFTIYDLAVGDDYKVVEVTYTRKK